MNRTHIEQEVTKLISDVLKTPVTIGSQRDSVHQWDSLKHIEVVFGVEEFFDLQFSETEIAQLDSVEKIVLQVSKHHAS